MDIAVLIPAFNEADKIADTVRAALSIDGVTRVVVIDDGSEDGTDHLAEAAGAKVVRMAGSAGKGGALEAGAKRVENADVILLLDGDLGESAAQGSLLLTPILDGSADMSVAAFPRPTGKAGFGLVLRLARWGIRRFGGDFDAAAPLSGQRALTRKCMEAVRPFAAGYGVEVALTIRSLRQGFRVVEVPTKMGHSATGRDLEGFVHRGKQFVHVAIALLRISREPANARTTDAR